MGDRVMSAGELLKRANRLKRAGKLDEAIALYREAIELNPDFAWTHYELGDALVKLGQLEAAIIEYNRAANLNPKSIFFNKASNKIMRQKLDNKCEKEIVQKICYKNPSKSEIKTEIDLSNNSCYQKYINLIKSCLLDDIYGSEVSGQNWNKERAGKKAILTEIENGNYWPARAHTMIGRKRLNNLQYCVEQVIMNQIDGDLIETGVWRGGATIFMKAILEMLNVQDKRVYVADSFEGLPQPEPDKYPADRGDKLFTIDYLKVSLNEVKENFKKYDLLDDKVIFIKGFFEESLKEEELKQVGIEKVAVLRLDGDMYSSTMQVLNSLYDKVVVGGYIIVDDYGAIRGCRAAVDHFRGERNIQKEMIEIDRTGVYWQKNSV